MEKPKKVQQCQLTVCVLTYASSFGPPSFTWPSHTMATTVTQRHFVRIKGHNMPSILSTTPIAEHVKLYIIQIVPNL